MTKKSNIFISAPIISQCLKFAPISFIKEFNYKTLCTRQQ